MIELLKLGGSLVGRWFTHKKDIGDAIHERKLEEIKQGGDWDSIHARGSMTSWKDEWFTILLSIPLVGAFFPPVVPHIMAGFSTLESMPDWYKAFLGLAVGAAFGYRKIMEFVHRKSGSANS